MSIVRTHLVLMFLYASATALFFSLLWRQEKRERIRFFLVVFCSLFFGAIVIGWIMFPFPLHR